GRTSRTGSSHPAPARSTPGSARRSTVRRSSTRLSASSWPAASAPPRPPSTSCGAPPSAATSRSTRWPPTSYRRSQAAPRYPPASAPPAPTAPRPGDPSSAAMTTRGATSMPSSRSRLTRARSSGPHARSGHTTKPCRPYQGAFHGTSLNVVSVTAGAPAARAWSRTASTSRPPMPRRMREGWTASCSRWTLPSTAEISANPAGGSPSTSTEDGSRTSSIMVVPGGNVMPACSKSPSAASSTATRPGSSLSSAHRTMPTRSHLRRGRRLRILGLLIVGSAVRRRDPLLDRARRPRTRWWARYVSEVQQALQPDRQPGQLAHPPHAEQHARGERGAVHRVVADGEGRAVAAEQHLLVGDEPGQADRVHTHAVDVGAARPVEPGAGGVGHRPHPGLGTGLGDQLGGAPGGARGGVGLVRVVQLDDLDRL